MKKIISIIAAALIACNLLGLFPEIAGIETPSFAVTASAAGYSTGEYRVTANEGVNVRKGPSTSYGKRGAAPKGTTFTVSYVDGNFGFTNTIYTCSNGYVSGYVYLPACTAISTASDSADTSSSVSEGIKIVNTNYSGYSLDCYAGYSDIETLVTLFTTHKAVNQQFQLLKSPYAGFYYIKAAYCDLYWNINYNPYGNQYKKLQLYTLDKTASNMLFKLEPKSNGGYGIQSYCGDKLAYNRYGEVYGTMDSVSDFYSTFYLEDIASSSPTVSNRPCSLSKMNEYADLWWNRRNTKYNYYDNNDCANYVSQLLAESGLATDNSWYSGSYAWVNVYGLKNYLEDTHNIEYISRPSVSDIQPGDIIYTNNGGHVMMVREIRNNRVYATGHTNNRQNLCITVTINGVLKTSTLFS